MNYVFSAVGSAALIAVICFFDHGTTSIEIETEPDGSRAVRQIDADGQPHGIETYDFADGSRLTTRYSHGLVIESELRNPDGTLRCRRWEDDSFRLRSTTCELMDQPANRRKPHGDRLMFRV